VFAPETDALANATAEHAAATAKVEELSAKKKELDARLCALVDKVKSGQATSGETLSLPDVAADTKRLAYELSDARSVLTMAEQTKEGAELASARERFENAIAQAQECRAAFEEIYKHACIVLGAYCALADTATATANKIARSNVGGIMMPEYRRKLDELSTPPNPLPSLLDAGYAGTTSFGYNFSMPVVPVQPKGAVK